MKSILAWIIAFMASCSMTPAYAFVPDVWAPTPEDVSLMYDSTKRVDPRSGDWLSQIGMQLRIHMRETMLGETLSYIWTLPGGPQFVADNIEAFMLVLGELGNENEAQNIGFVTSDGKEYAIVSGDWNFGPDYNWNGNLVGVARKSKSFILNLSKKMNLTVPPRIAAYLVIAKIANGTRYIDNEANTPVVPVLAGPCISGRCAKGNKACSTNNDCKQSIATKNLGMLTSTGGCDPLTADQDAKLTKMLAAHHKSSHCWIDTNAPCSTPSTFKADRDAFEGSARSGDEQARFTIPGFPGTVATNRLKPDRDALEQYVMTEMDAWADAVRTCYQNPRLKKKAIWTHGKMHRRGHDFLSMYFPGVPYALRRTCTVAEAGSLLNATNMNGCPDEGWPPTTVAPF